MGPVLGVFHVEGRDLRLQRVAAATAEGQRPLECVSALPDLLRVPEGAVLVGQEDDRARDDPRLPP